MIKKTLIGLAGLALILSAVVPANAQRIAPRPLSETNPTENLKINTTKIAERLSEAIRFKTISHSRETPEANDALEQEKINKAFMGLHKFLPDAFPLVHKTLKRQTINDKSLLYTWKGKTPELPAILLSAHMDVVPIEPGTKGRWKYPPFAGDIKDGYVWGRGAMDMKSSMMAALEAIEGLLAGNFQPKRTIYLAFGHDEELGGTEGAAHIGRLLHERNVKLKFTIDEGLVVTKGILPGVEKPVALIGIAEKGFITLKLTAHGPGGHGSMPPSNSAIIKLAKAVTAIEDNPMPARLGEVVTDMLDQVAPEMELMPRLLISNAWLFEPLILSRLAKEPSTNALIRTTTAVTVFKGGVKPNIIPQTAEATINVRKLHGDTTASVLDHLKQVIADPDIEIKIVPGTDLPASPISDIESDSYQMISDATREVFPEAVVAPGLLVGATDSRHYQDMAEDSFRFLPLRMTKDDLKRFHGTNERISISNYAEIIRFYAKLLRESASE